MKQVGLALPQIYPKKMSRRPRHSELERLPQHEGSFGQLVVLFTRVILIISRWFECNINNDHQAEEQQFIITSLEEMYSGGFLEHRVRTGHDG